MFKSHNEAIKSRKLQMQENLELRSEWLYRKNKLLEIFTKNFNYEKHIVQPNLT